VEHPAAVKQLAIEFARAGGDVTQTYTFFSDDIRLKEWHGPEAPTVHFNICRFQLYFSNVRGGGNCEAISDGAGVSL
jgi:hypothetical protein